MWVRVDDQLHAHPKVQQVWQACEPALGLHLLALSHAACYMTDGHVGEAFVRQQMPRSALRQRAIAALLDAGLWKPNGDGWVIHDFLEYNESKKDVTERRRRDSARKRNGHGAES